MENNFWMTGTPAGRADRMHLTVNWGLFVVVAESTFVNFV
jgi:hypothetical protein